MQIEVCRVHGLYSHLWVEPSALVPLPSYSWHPGVASWQPTCSQGAVLLYFDEWHTQLNQLCVLPCLFPPYPLPAVQRVRHAGSAGGAQP